MRHLLFAAAFLLAACSSNPPATGALRVEVEFNSSLASRCVKVTATDGVVTREGNAIPLSGKTSPLIILILPQGMLSSVNVQALGYADEACTQRTSPPEQSDLVEGLFEEPFGTVKLVLAPERPDAGTDAGVDGGIDAGTDAGIDGGTDGGVDSDNDGWNDDVDCEPFNPAVHPGAGETCSDTIDNDCNGLTDCMEAVCDGTPCPEGTCMNLNCVQPMMETLCNDGFDNDGDTFIDCLDPDCTGLACNDGSACTSAEVCIADGGCAPGITEMCMAAPMCRSSPGICNPVDGGCTYVPNTAPCDDNNVCTDDDVCANGECSGQLKTCGQPPQCRGAGVCQVALDGGCFFPPLTTSAGCNDGNNCTLNDRCDGDGGCMADAPTNCSVPPTPCHSATNTCNPDATCVWGQVMGAACDAGMGVEGTCGANFVCNPPVLAPVFPYTPSNFAPSQLPDSGIPMTVTANVTINTSTFPPTATGGFTLPPSVEIDGGRPVVLFRVDSLTVNPGIVLTVNGARPVIFAVTGDANIGTDGGIVVNAGVGSATDCGFGGNGTLGTNDACEAGAGGGGFGSDGGLGGQCAGTTRGARGLQNGNAELVPLRGGCRGGNTETTTSGHGGAGGGAVQISVAGTFTVNGRIGTPGRGGFGATGGDNGGGGGGSGGAVLLEASQLNLQTNARVTANGGAGGEGSSNSAGNDGQDGHINDDVPAVGGNGGSSNGHDGAAGATGSAGAGSGGPGSGNTNNGGGGGGGGVGRIRFNFFNGCTRQSGAVVSPASTYGGSVDCL